MGNSSYNKELFEFEDKPKRRFISLRGILPKGDFENRFLLTITPERLVFIAIGMVMVLVIVFALGVEKGKAIGRASGGKVIVTVAKPTPPAAAKPAAPLAPKVAPPKTAAPENASKPYTIVAVTLTRKDTASAEAWRLEREGFEPSVYQSGDYFLVCVGAYPTKGSAQNSLKRVKRFYKDAYLKLR